MEYVKTILGYTESEKKRYAYKPYRQPGCKNICRYEMHMPMNQVWRIRKLNPGKLVLFCRECLYCTTSSHKRCYCCGNPMGFTHARMNESRQINNEKKTRY